MQQVCTTTSYHNAITMRRFVGEIGRRTVCHFTSFLISVWWPKVSCFDSLGKQWGAIDDRDRLQFASLRRHWKRHLFHPRAKRCLMINAELKSQRHINLKPETDARVSFLAQETLSLPFSAGLANRHRGLRQKWTECRLTSSLHSPNQN